LPAKVTVHSIDRTFLFNSKQKSIETVVRSCFRSSCEIVICIYPVKALKEAVGVITCIPSLHMIKITILYIIISLPITS